MACDNWSAFHLNPNEFTLEQLYAYVFVVDAMNFCFWPKNPAGQFEYEHIAKNVAKILRNEPEFFKSENLAKVSASDLKSKVYNNLDFGLLEERARIVREVGAMISFFYDSSFTKFVETSNFDAPTLVK